MYNYVLVRTYFHFSFDYNDNDNDNIVLKNTQQTNFS